jgi:SAM-dependent methyltransferase
MRAWTPRLCCPHCQAPTSAGDTGALCGRCGYSIEVRDGIIRCLSATAAAKAAPFLDQYRLVREREGYRAADAEYYRGLPRVARSDPHAAEWRIRSESYRHLVRRAFSGTAPKRVLDLGAGNGWLSHRLAGRGHRVVALDQSDDDHDGLGVCRVYPVPFAAVQADFHELPFQSGSFDVVVFDASLHYATEPAAVVEEARRMLATGGAIAVVDSPMFADERDGEAMVRDKRRHLRKAHGLKEDLSTGIGYLTFGWLERTARAGGLSGRFVPSRGPWVWRVKRRLSRRSIGREPAAFGVWVAR